MIVEVVEGRWDEMLATDASMTLLNISAAATGSLSRLRAPSSRVDVPFTRVSWCDLNGDGRVDTRSALQGGDATMLVPTHDAATSNRAALPLQSQAAQPVDYPYLFASERRGYTTVGAAVANYVRDGRQLAPQTPTERGSDRAPGLSA